MHIHLTRNGEVLALFEIGSKQEWNLISRDELVAGVKSMRGMDDVMVFLSADDPEQFASNPSPIMREIVETIQGFGIPLKPLVKPLVPIQGRDSADSEAVLRVSILKSGVLLIDGRSTNFDDLDAALASHAAKKGVVWYYREGADGEAPPEAMKVLQLIVKHRCPISMSSRPDFSDAIDQHGHSVPRQP